MHPKSVNAYTVRLAKGEVQEKRVDVSEDIVYSHISNEHFTLSIIEELN